MKEFEKQFNIKTKLETLDQYIKSILNKHDPDDEIEEDTVIYSFSEGKAAYRAHHMLYVDQKFDWSKIPN